jgi:ion channel-forming bestrophin family protein
MFLRIHGSLLPGLILPLLFVGLWTTTVCLFSRHVHDREFNFRNTDISFG